MSSGSGYAYLQGNSRDPHQQSRKKLICSYSFFAALM